MIHKTISAANELRAPPLARRKRPKLVYHSRLAGIEKNTRTPRPDCLGWHGEWKLFAWTLCASPRATT